MAEKGVALSSRRKHRKWNGIYLHIDCFEIKKFHNLRN